MDDVDGGRRLPGLATGLIYAPGSYAATDEIVGIARRAGGAARLLRQPHPRRGRDSARRRPRGHTAWAARAGCRCRSATSRRRAAPNWGQGGRGPRPHRRRARRGARRACADVYPVHRFQHHPAHAPARLGAGGRHRDHARAASPTPPRASASAPSCRAAAGSCTRGLAWEDIMVAYAPSRPDARGPAPVGDRGGVGQGPPRRGDRSHRLRARQGLR